MKEFAYSRANGVREALVMVAEQENGRFLGGGTNLVDLMKRGVEAPDLLVDVRSLPLAGVREDDDGDVVIGATTTNSDAAAHPEVRRRYPALSQAVLAGASGQLRNVATVAGNLLQRTRCAFFADLSTACNKRVPGSGCAALAGVHHNHAILGTSPSCVATNPSDMAVSLMLFDAVVHYETLDGEGEIPLSRFYRPVGDTPHVETALPAGALITSVRLPRATAGERSRYRKVRERASYAFATVSVAADLEVRAGRVHEVRIALGGVASHPWRARIAEEELRGGPAVPERFRAAAEAELAAARALPHNGYKVTLARNLIQSVLTEIAG
ncbi:xanthine dehydrogenase YagS FAD-binding subunit [Lentzea fradiae]|uniref:Xanthine dehydrogenase YagS FAD-binding subunit n=1 Tax=Lentzea fradiae TaxID=200378 RepID=A0A1G7L2V2_9PSEU|nr:xanthine dehydrogenase family protein subunit M [Lentzea fradiae]SDF43420.1 xanthine dehydrogenase YagS FAD-binding subunit [Lentzea fradiae]